MPLESSESGKPSPLFGTKFPYILDGKILIREIATEFANEFTFHGKQKTGRDLPLAVTSAFPTMAQQCPVIAIVRDNSTVKQAGVGGEIYTASNGVNYSHVRGNLISDSITVNICTLNERMRDDLFLWFQQYLLDAQIHILPQLANVYDMRVVSAMDDTVEYQGSQAQPGFEFYIARISVQVGYEQIVLSEVDSIAGIVNWQAICMCYENIPIQPEIEAKD